MKLNQLVAAACVALVTVSGVACVGPDDVGSDASDLTELKDLYRDFRNLDLNDLLSISAGFATDELNDLLEVSNYGGIELQPTELYALGQDAKDDLTLKDIDALVSGLVTRYGERELTTEVNQVRQRYLQQSSDDVYGESAFAIQAGHGWTHQVGGFDEGNVSIGFDAGATLEARVIQASRSEVAAHWQSPLAAAKEMRGFVLPRSVNDLMALKPGESYALRGSGRLGVNLGVGVPILIAAVDAISYNLVLSAGVRALLEGQVDVQVVRLEGDEIVIDVGVEQTSVRQARVAMRDGWGVHGLIESHIEIGGISVDLGRLVDKAVQRTLNKKLSLVSASLEKTNNHSRISVARFRVNLSAATPGSPLEIALQHVLRADLRLAQALSNRYEPGIRAEFELTRSGVSSTSYAGIDILGMSFFRKVQAGEGTIVVQTPGGARAIYFESLHKESGWFFSSHGYTRVGLSGMVFDPEHPDGAQGEANVLFQVVEGDKKMERDKLLDHLDGIILGVAGEPALTALEGPANELERYVEVYCPNSEAFDPCRDEVLDTQTVKDLRQAGRDALAAATQGLDEAPRQLVLAAGELRLTAQATYEPKAQWVGPPTSIVVDYRLDDLALGRALLDHDAGDFRAALLAYLRAAEIDRIDGPAEIAAEREAITQVATKLANDAEAVFADKRNRYGLLVATERLQLPAHPELGELGSSAIEIRFPVDSNNTVVYEDAVSRSLAQARAHVVTELVDELIAVSKQDGTSKHPEQLAAYSLLALTPTSSVDLRLDVDLDVSDTWEQDFSHYRKAGYASLDVYAQGTEVSPIDGGMFDIDQLIAVP